MKFALLGADAESCLLVQAAADLGHEIVWYGDLARVDRASHPWLADADQADDWETLFDRDFCDFVILGQGDTPAARRVEQVIQLVRIGIPLLTTFPLHESVLSYYEIDMARLESGAVLHHFNPLVANMSRIEEFATWVRAGHPQLGSIEQVICDRPLADRARKNVMWHFARDVELLDNIAGPLDRLGALGSPDEAATYSGLSVQLLGKTQVPVRWSVGPADQSNFPSLTFLGQQGRARFEYDESSVFRSLETSVPAELIPATAASQCLKRFIAAQNEPTAPNSTWAAALRAMELADTIEISLRRGRMIDVHRQQLTEELSFRGTMSAVGCGVLMLLPPLLLLAGWIAELMGLPMANYWAHGLLAILTLFLLIQFAPKLLLKNKDSK